MDGVVERGLRERIEALEVEVAAQGEILRSLRGTDNAVARGDRVEWSGEAGVPVASLVERYGYLLRAEWWLTRGGVVLLLAGLAFLFKLSVDEGWVTPAVRVLFGVVLGAGLIGGGLRVFGRRAVVGQAMIGGGIAALYCSVFAAASLYSLIPSVVAFPLMVAITIGAFSLAIRQDASSLAVIGLVGGLATPFAIYDGEGSVSGLVTYVCVVLTGAVAVYLYRGWNVLLASASAGAMVSLFAAMSMSFPLGQAEILPLLVGAVYCGVISCAVPSVRSAVLRIRRPASSLPLALVAGAFIVPVTSVTLFGIVADFQGVDNGVSMILVALWGGACSWLLRRARWFADGRIVYAYLAGAVGIGTLGLGLALPGWIFFVVLAGISGALLYVAGRFTDGLARFAGHAGFGFLACWFATEVTVSRALSFTDDIRWDMNIAMLVGIGAAFVTAMTFLGGRSRVAYLLSVHVAVLAWLLVVISPLPNGGMLTTVAWGIFGAGLFVASLRLDGTLAFNVALTTLGLVVAKLIILDLFWVEALYRVLLFLGIGGLFLCLGYYLQRIWKPRLDEPVRRDGRDVA